jgi:DNA polymerase-3 subunit beta
MPMKFTANAAAFAEAAAAVQRVIDRKTKIPLLMNILIEVGNGEIKIRGTHLDHELTAAFAADVVEGGAVAVPGERLAGLLARLDQGAAVKIETTDRGVALKAGRSRYLVECLPPGEFPAPLSAEEDAAELTLDGEAVRRLFAVPAIAVSSEETRYYLCGIFLHQVDGRLAACATNGHQLVLETTDILVSRMPANDGRCGIIIPAKACSEIARLGKGGATIRVNDRVVEAHAGALRLASKLIDGTFPAFERVIPPPSASVAEFARGPALSAFERLAAVAGRTEKAPIAGLAWSDAGEIEFSFTDDPEAATDLVPALTTGEARVAVPLRQIIALLDALRGERIRLNPDGPCSPIRINVIGDEAMLAVQMPARG